MPEIVPGDASRYAEATRAGPATASSSSRCEAPTSCQPVTRPSTTGPGGRARARDPSSRATAGLRRRPLRPTRARASPSCLPRQPATGLLCQVHQPRGVRGHVERFCEGWLPGSAEETPACRVIGAKAIPEETSEVTNSALNGRAALTISRCRAAARIPFGSCSTARPRDVGVSDRSPVPGQVGRDVALDREPRDPQPAAGDGGLGVRRQGDERRLRRAGRCAHRAGHPGGARSRCAGRVRPPRRDRRGPSRNGP